MRVREGKPIMRRELVVVLVVVVLGPFAEKAVGVEVGATVVAGGAVTSMNSSRKCCSFRATP